MIFGAQIPVANPKQQQLGMEPPPSGRFVVGTDVLLYEDPEHSQSYGFDLSFQARYVGAGRTYSELSDFLPNFNQRKVNDNRDPKLGLSPDSIVYSDFANPNNYATQFMGASCGAVKGIPCGELTYVDEYVQIRAQLALNLQLARYLSIRGGVALEHDTDHFLTDEKVGTDQDPASIKGTAADNCNGAPCVGRVNAQNSYYDHAHNVCNAPDGKSCDERSPYYDPRYDAPGTRFRIEQELNFIVFVNATGTF
jgi:hypothetical protein